MNNHQQTSASYFGQLKLIHFALIMGQVLFAMVAFFINSLNDEKMILGYGLNAQIFVAILVLVAIFGSNALVRKGLRELNVTDQLGSKLIAYRTIQIVRFGILEAVSLVTLLAFFLTGDISFLAFSALIIVFLVIHQPGRERLATDLKLNPSDKAIIDDPAAIIQ